MISKKFLFLISVILFILFVFYSYLVAKEQFSQLDFDMTVKFQDKIPRKLDAPFSLLSYLGSVEVTGLIWLALTGYVLIRRFWMTFLAMFLLPAALFLELFGKTFVFHPAPTYMFYRGTFNFNFPSFFVHTDYSYPSGHMTRTAFLAIFVMTYAYLRYPKQVQLIIIPCLCVLMFLMAISRIYLGEHWTTDVIGGILVGAATGLASGATLKPVHSGSVKVIS